MIYKLSSNNIANKQFTSFDLSVFFLLIWRHVQFRTEPNQLFVGNLVCLENCSCFSDARSILLSHVLPENSWKTPSQEQISVECPSFSFYPDCRQWSLAGSPQCQLFHELKHSETSSNLLKNYWRNKYGRERKTVPLSTKPLWKLTSLSREPVWYSGKNWFPRERRGLPRFLFQQLSGPLSENCQLIRRRLIISNISIVQSNFSNYISRKGVCNEGFMHFNFLFHLIFFSKLQLNSSEKVSSQIECIHPTPNQWIACFERECLFKLLGRSDVSLQDSRNLQDFSVLVRQLRFKILTSVFWC